jgi:hypothetical protein
MVETHLATIEGIYCQVATKLVICNFEKNKNQHLRYCQKHIY